MENMLKPCPCGSEKSMYFVLSNSRSPFMGHTVFCPKCQRRVMSISKRKVIEKWNRRVDDE